MCCAEIEKLPPVQLANPYVFNEPNDPISASTSSASGAVKMVTRSKFTTKKTAKQNTRTAKSPSSKVLRHSARQQKIKNIEEKANQALKYKEDILKEKAERAKRDREEHRQRVEQNNRLKEAEQREREQQLRAQEKRLQEFRLEQEKLERNACLSKSPFRAGLGVSALPKTTPRHLAIQPSKTTPRQLVVPLKRSKNADNNQFEDGNLRAAEEDVRVKEEDRKGDQLEKERREQERQEQERCEQEIREQELREQELREQRRLEMERREQERLEQECLEQKRLQQEKQDKERHDKERAEKERREKERRETAAEERTTREGTQRAATSAVVTHTYDMTPDKIYLPSSENNYNVDDLSSHDETDNDEKPRKEVPKWAQKNTLAKKVAALHNFSQKNDQYPLRNSSAIWTSPMGDPTPGESRFMNFQCNTYDVNLVAVDSPSDLSKRAIATLLLSVWIFYNILGNGHATIVQKRLSSNVPYIQDRRRPCNGQRHSVLSVMGCIRITAKFAMDGSTMTETALSAVASEWMQWLQWLNED
uniref:Inner centromere protein ARK-binding domain-containing protein n=1 Tax=Ditylenchus dipsaci TaxID=166011 RepID=A0A915EBP6_9BILA